MLIILQGGPSRRPLAFGGPTAVVDHRLNGGRAAPRRAGGGTSPGSYNRPPVAPPMNGFRDGSVLRLLDANLNRAREGLRVVEDYARFVLDDAQLCGALKRIRHGLAEATRDLTDTAILHRDTPGDVGTSVKATSEALREDAGDVVTAAGKRVGEALRAVEEFLKTASA